MLRSFATTTTSKLGADLTGLIRVPVMSTVEKRDGFLNFDVMCTTSVLSSFRFKWLAEDHDFTSIMHCSSLGISVECSLCLIA